MKKTMTPLKAAWFSLFVAAACGTNQKAKPPAHGAAGAGNRAGAAGRGGSTSAGTGGTVGNAGNPGNAGAEEGGASSGDVGGTTGTPTGGKSGKGGTSGKGGSSGTSGSGGSPPQGPTFKTYQAAEVVIGQADFVSNRKASQASAATTDSTSGSAAFDGKRLFVSDTYTERVLGFASLPTTNGASANVVLGQAKMSTTAPGTTADKLYQPESLHTDGTTLAIADAGNHRVLLVPVGAATGASAAIVVGWPDAGTPSSGCSNALLRSPASAFIVKGKLLVADRANNRVLIWTKVPTKSGVAANLVLGQTSLTSCVANDSLRNGTVGLRSEGTLRSPSDVWSDGKRVLVVDRDNNRVLGWSSFPTENGAAADLVIGQSSFDHARDDANASGLLRPSAVAYTGGYLFIADAGHNRVLGWSAFPSDNGTAADVVLGQKDFKHVGANDVTQTGKTGLAPNEKTMAFPSGVTLAGDALVVNDTLNRRALVFRPH
jgi:hypothetical protein